MRWIFLRALSLLLGATPFAAAQTADELAKQTQNPVASLMSVPFQGNWDFGLGDRNATATLLNIQPVMPFAVSKSTNIILRIILPLTSQPASDGERISGLGDTVTTVFFSPAKTGRLIWGVGPVFLLPTATNNALGSEKLGLGPSVVALMPPAPRWPARTPAPTGASAYRRTSCFPVDSQASKESVMRGESGSRQ